MEQSIENAIAELIDRINKDYAKCREVSLVITKLEEAALWFSKIP